MASLSNDEGRIAAKLHRYFLHRVGRLSKKELTLTSVEPVNVIFLTNGLLVSSPPIAPRVCGQHGQ
jgi:hypothetical protein